MRSFRRRGRFATGKKAWVVDDRSGLSVRYRNTIREPGTGIRVHRSESDGKYNIRDHPQQRVKAPPADRESLYDQRVDSDEVTSIGTSANAWLDSLNIDPEAIKFGSTASVSAEPS